MCCFACDAGCATLCCALLCAAPSIDSFVHAVGVGVGVGGTGLEDPGRSDRFAFIRPADGCLAMDRVSFVASAPGSRLATAGRRISAQSCHSTRRGAHNPGIMHVMQSPLRQ